MITKNFSLNELIYSDTAKKLKINNEPKDNQIIINLTLLVNNFLQPLRDIINKPIIISSGYRCEKLNKAIGGVKNSGHLTGRCVDFIINGMKIEEIINIILNSELKYRQLIREKSNGKEWIHVDYKIDDLKKENLIFENGKYNQLN